VGEPEELGDVDQADPLNAGNIKVRHGRALRPGHDEL
jgi:hypothetical protein